MINDDDDDDNDDDDDDDGDEGTSRYFDVSQLLYRPCCGPWLW